LADKPARTFDDIQELAGDGLTDYFLNWTWDFDIALSNDRKGNRVWAERRLEIFDDLGSRLVDEESSNAVNSGMGSSTTRSRGVMIIQGSSGVQGGIAVPDLLSIRVNRHNVLKQWRRRFEQFSNIRGNEEAYYPLIYPMEQQIGFLVNQNAHYVDEDVLFALAICGLRCIEQLSSVERFTFEALSDEVMTMADRCSAVFHPDFNPKVMELMNAKSRSEEIRSTHFTEFGSAIRRLMYSVEYWGKGSHRGYCQHVLPFLEQAGYDVTEDQIHVTVMIDPQHANPS